MKMDARVHTSIFGRPRSFPETLAYFNCFDVFSNNILENVDS